MKALGIPYFTSEASDRAKVIMQGDSICSFCSRMKGARCIRAAGRRDTTCLR